MPAYGNGNNCSFEVKGLRMSFGELNPSSGANMPGPLSGASTAGDCAPGHDMKISGDDGQNYFNGTRHLQGDTGDFIPYSLPDLPKIQRGPGNGNYVPVQFSGLILWSAYANAPAGHYSDTVIISVTP